VQPQVLAKPVGQGLVNQPRVTLEQCVSEDVDISNPNREYHTVSAFLLFIPHDRPLWYASCQHPKETGKPCVKKVEQNAEGRWECKDRHVTDAPKYRYMMSMKIGDMTSSLDVVKAFDEVGEALLGKSADEMKALQDNNPQEFENVFTERHFTMWVMKIRSKETTFREESKLER
jgi:replication factor A1